MLIILKHRFFFKSTQHACLTSKLDNDEYSLIFRQSKDNYFSTSDDVLMKLHMHHHTMAIYKFHEIPWHFESQNGLTLIA